MVFFWKMVRIQTGTDDDVEVMRYSVNVCATKSKSTSYVSGYLRLTDLHVTSTRALPTVLSSERFTLSTLSLFAVALPIAAQ